MRKNPPPTPQNLIDYDQQQKSRKRSKASQAGHAKRTKRSTKELVTQLVMTAKAVRQQHADSNAAYQLYCEPITSLSLSTATYMQQQLSALQNLCRLNALMVSGTKTELTLKLIRCQLHVSPGPCPTCGHSKLQFEYIDDMNPTTMPNFVECKHFYGPGRRCPFGRKVVHNKYPFVPMTTDETTRRQPVRRDQQVHTVVNGFAGAMYLKVKYADKEKAKQLGCRYDPNNRLWYVPMELTGEIGPFEQWMSSLVIQEKSGTAQCSSSSEADEEEYPSSYA